MFCPRCCLSQPLEHRFCVSCGAVLPRELLRSTGPKVTRWFRSIPVHPEDDPDGLLRVSRYVDEFDIETSDGSVRIPNHHVRFSIWSGDRAHCVISIPDDEAEDLAAFLLAQVRDGQASATRASG